MSSITNEKISITDSEKTTAIYLLRDMTVKEISFLRHISFDGIQSQTKRIREKTGTSTIHGALARLIAAEVIKQDELASCLPKDGVDPSFL
jgi:hypothetical protein